MANHFRAVIYLVGIAFGTFASAANELVISEYIEGTSNNKAIELCNPSSSAVNLATDNYVLFISFNGGTSTSTIPLSGTVPAGGSFVIANNQASTNILSKANQTSSSLSFNGDDAIVLKVGAAGTVVDSYGQVGVRLTLVQTRLTARSLVESGMLSLPMLSIARSNTTSSPWTLSTV
ncbi:Lamin Tail Domain [Fragilaria crotonensis]|nr:Lamin Tail Domain [Fragilaria crotonensis]